MQPKLSLIQESQYDSSYRIGHMAKTGGKRPVSVNKVQRQNRTRSRAALTPGHCCCPQMHPFPVRSDETEPRERKGLSENV